MQYTSNINGVLKGCIVSYMKLFLLFKGLNLGYMALFRSGVPRGLVVSVIYCGPTHPRASGVPGGGGAGGPWPPGASLGGGARPRIFFS